MKKCILLVLVAMLLGAPAYAQKPVTVLGPGLNSGRTEFHQNYDRVLSADTVYTLTGLYYVDSTYTITIPQGTVVRGDTAATLIVSRGAQIYALGTPQNPVVLTSLKAPNDREPGDWGGVILLGRAPCNKVEPLIEGGIIGGSYGGNDPDDNSGIFRYVRIEFPGYRFQLNNEVNGLTMGAVGRGTELHHVQVSYSFDDSFEWFGGTVDAHHLVAFGGTDDEFDTDFGFQGRLQYGLGIRDPFYWDPTGESRGFESDNDGSSTSTATPYTHPVFSNFTLIGPFLEAGTYVPPGNTYDYSVTIRRSSRTSIFNSIIAGYVFGFSMRDPFTHAAAMNDVLQVRNVSLAATTEKIAGTGSVHDDGRWAPDSTTLWFDTPSYANHGTAPRYMAALGLTNMADPHDPDPVPAAGSEVDGSADFSSPLLDGFDIVGYRGAFAPGTDIRTSWIAEWTNFDPKTTVYNPVPTGSDDVPAAGALSQNFPNPFNPVTTIRFSIARKGHVSLHVYDVAGKKVATLVDGSLSAGRHDVRFNAQNLSSGTYFYRIQGPGIEQTRKMVLLR